MSSGFEEQLNIGEDSFMDTIANLVGVLIILVAVVGLRADKMLGTPDLTQERQTELSTLETNAKKANRIANTLEADAGQLEQDLAFEQRSAARLAEERRQKLIWLELARRQIQEQAADFDQRARQRLELVSTQSQLQQELAQLQMRQRAQAAEAPREIDLIHYPTPIAKTVFSDEVHFRLAQGKLHHVPIDDLLAAMKAEWKYQAEKQLAENSSVVESVGPIDDCMMEYELVMEGPNPGQPVIPGQQYFVRFNRFAIFPIKPQIGEPLETALAESSAFRQKLRNFVPGKTTVSVWVYPDSYQELAKLKDWLREQGFQTACWPLETGRPITGGPNGLRTTAQ